MIRKYNIISLWKRIVLFSVSQIVENWKQEEINVGIEVLYTVYNTG